jgi:hypothetical protein
MKAAFMVLFALCALQGGAQAQELPFKPLPQGIDREFIIENAAMWTSFATDTYTTHHDFATYSFAHEGGYLFTGSRSTVKVMGAWAAVDIGATILSYEMKRHITNKYLHPLWRVPLILETAGHTQATFENMRKP